MASKYTQNYIYDKIARIYYDMVVNDKDVSVFVNPSPKNVTRVQDESSLRSTIGFILTVLLTSLIKGYPKNDFISSKKMVMMVQSCFIKYFMMYIVKNIFTQCCIHYQQVQMITHCVFTSKVLRRNNIMDVQS